MQPNPKFFPKQSSFFTAFGFCLFLLAVVGCQKESVQQLENPEKEKKILDFDITFTEVVINQAKRQIIIYETENLGKVTPKIEVSPDVTIQPASGATIDETKPVTYTLTAKDGSSTTYTVIVCSVDWEYTEAYSGAFGITGMGHFKEPWTAVSKDGQITIHFGTATESAVDVFLKSPLSAALVSQFPVATYAPGSIPAGKASATFTYRENGTVKTFAKPLSGTVKITQYDAANGTISGEMIDIKYWGNNTQTQGYPIIYVDGKFKNLPVEVK